MVRHCSTAHSCNGSLQSMPCLHDGLLVGHWLSLRSILSDMLLRLRLRVCLIRPWGWRLQLRRLPPSCYSPRPLRARRNRRRPPSLLLTPTQDLRTGLVQREVENWIFVWSQAHCRTGI